MTSNESTFREQLDEQFAAAENRALEKLGRPVTREEFRISAIRYALEVARIVGEGLFNEDVTLRVHLHPTLNYLAEQWNPFFELDNPRGEQLKNAAQQVLEGLSELPMPNPDVTPSVVVDAVSEIAQNFKQIRDFYYERV